jgi:hypothetical protein
MGSPFIFWLVLSFSSSFFIRKFSWNDGYDLVSGLYHFFSLIKRCPKVDIKVINPIRSQTIAKSSLTFISLGQDDMSALSTKLEGLGYLDIHV